MLYGKAYSLFLNWDFWEVLNSHEENGEKSNKKLSKGEKK